MTSASNTAHKGRQINNNVVIIECRLKIRPNHKHAHQNTCTQ